MEKNKLSLIIISKDNYYITSFCSTPKEAVKYFLGHYNGLLNGTCIAVAVLPKEMENPHLYSLAYLDVYRKYGIVPFLVYVAEIWGRTNIVPQIQDNDLRNEVNHLLWVLDGVAETQNENYLKFKHDFLQIPQD